ncbi:MAG: L,D-transpeptidase [Chloroflexi bacterium]|nr:L,D-transpeptidase [Chloroflexota bacterium]
MTSQPGTIYAEIIADTPTSEYVAPTAVPYIPPVAGTGGEHWIDVNLSEQRVYAYEGDTVVNSFIVSTGTWQTPTVTGRYKIWIKLLSTTMTGPGYYLPNVPYTMYFYKGYGLHGTYWHNNFGTPMSHGCVNLRTSDAEWLYNFSSVGTVVNVHY